MWAGNGPLLAKDSHANRVVLLMHDAVTGAQGVVQILQHLERHLQRHQLEAQLSTDEASYRVTYDVRPQLSACSMLLQAPFMAYAHGSPTA